MSRVLIYGTAAWTGAAVMLVELLGARQLAPWFGNGTHVWGAVLTVFMLALALGYLAGGQLSRTHCSTRSIGTALLLAAGCLTPVIFAAPWVLELVFRSTSDPRAGALMAAMALYLAPTAVHGAVAPLAVRLLTQEARDSGSVSGTLYFVSTLGSVVGTLVTSFYLVLYFDITDILGACAISTAILSGVLLLWRPKRVA